MPFLTPIVALLLLSLFPRATIAREHVAMLLQHHTYTAIERHLDQYVQDVEARFPVDVQVITGQWKTPNDVRENIKSLSREQAISGVVLVGAMPMHLFFMHEHPNPNPLYYEDFDLEFVDTNGDGVDDAYRGMPDLKVWVANIRATEKGSDDDIPGLRRFFAKTHDYYTGQAVPEPRTLLVSAEIPTTDGAGAGDWFKRRGGARFSAPGDVTLLEGASCTHKAVLDAFEEHSYTLTCVAVHSDETGHALNDKDLSAQEIAELTTGSLITISHGCFAANWTKTEHDNNGPNCGLSWVFAEHYGQALVGQVRSGGVGFDNLIYERLRAGDYLGKAYLPCKQAHEIEHAMGDHVPGDIVSGILMVGNPFLSLAAVPRGANTQLVINHAVYGDLVNGAVVDVTRKVTDWLEDSLPIQATAEDFGDPASGVEKQLKVDYTLDGVDGTITIEEGQFLKIGT